jgi:hypothetical protein
MYRFILVAVVLFFILVMPAYAWNNNQQGNDDSKFKYRGSSGTQYQYDMGNPGDKARYQLDLDAQRRDQMSLDPRRNLDQGLGQQGGGIRK